MDQVFLISTTAKLSYAGRCKMTRDLDREAPNGAPNGAPK